MHGYQGCKYLYRVSLRSGSWSTRVRTIKLVLIACIMAVVKEPDSFFTRLHSHTSNASSFLTSAVQRVQISEAYVTRLHANQGLNYNYII